MTLHQLLFDDEPPTALQAYVRHRLELEIGEAAAAAIQKLAKERRKSGKYEFDDHCLIVLKNELERLGCFDYRGEQVTDNAVPIKLHFFFLSLEETPEMLERISYDQTSIERVAARSKMFNTHLIPQPIDAVAARVTGDVA